MGEKFIFGHQFESTNQSSEKTGYNPAISIVDLIGIMPSSNQPEGSTVDIDRLLGLTNGTDNGQRPQAEQEYLYFGDLNL